MDESQENPRRIKDVFIAHSHQCFLEFQYEFHRSLLFGLLLCSVACIENPAPKTVDLRTMLNLISENIVAADIADRCEVQVSYAIGVVEPTSIFVDTYGTSNIDLTDGEIANKVAEIFDMRPAAIEQRLKLRNPIYQETAAYGHMGKDPEMVTKIFESPYSGKIEKEVEIFTWEKLDYVDKVKSKFGI